MAAAAAAAPAQRQAAPPSPQAPPGFATPHPQIAPEPAPTSAQVSPGVWVPPQAAAAASLLQCAPVMPPQQQPPPPPQQQHCAPGMAPPVGSLQGAPMTSQAAHPVDVMASLPLQFASQQALHCAVPSASQLMGLQSFMATQQPQTGAQPPLPPGPPPAMLQLQQQQQQQLQQTDQMMITQQPQQFVPPPVMQHQQQPQQADQMMMMMMQQPLQFGIPPVMPPPPPPSQASLAMMAQPHLAFGPAPVMGQQPTQAEPAMVAQSHQSAPTSKRQRADQYDMPCGQGQHRTNHQQDLSSSFNGAMGTTYGSYYVNNAVKLSSFGVPEPPLPPDASSTVFVEVRLTLQGYKFDEQDQHSPIMRLQFSHNPRQS
ncbi:hypothetical protein ACP4OV_023438 [Aristida adscensionis]